MSNPVATLGNSIPSPADPKVTRKTYTMVVYDQQDFFLYAEGEDDTNFDPTNKGQKLYVFQRLGQITGFQQPAFVSNEQWTSVKKAPSGFVTGVHSVMPKLMVPSQVLVDNGVVTDLSTLMGEYQQGGTWKGLFNWIGISINGSAPSPDWQSVWYKCCHVGGYYGSQYVTTRWKDDLSAANELVLELNISLDPPLGPWDETTLVVGGAFVFFLNVTPTTSGGDTPENANNNPWLVTVEFGDVKLEIGDAGSLKATITSGDNNTVSGNLAEGATKEGPPQQRHIEGKQPYIIVVYPVWNGIVVQSGGQDAAGVVKTSTTFVPKYREASIFVDYSNGFDPTSPAPVVVDTVASGKDVIVDFGTKMTVTLNNCRIDLAYLPCFFSTQCWFDEWMVLADDQAGVVAYDYKVWPIWTANATDYSLGTVSVSTSGFQGPTPNTSYRYIKWRLDRTDKTKFLRYAGEIFGSIFETDETREFPIKNDNGNFVLNWSGGTPGNIGGSTNWKDYVQSVNITVDVDGSNGSVAVDKYGVAGQSATAVQSIGAFTIDATGGYNTVPGGLFKGLAMGIADSEQTGGSTWTIPLVGQEKKLEDIALINVPFMDGRTLAETVDFLARYAGINYDLSAANPSVRLSVSSDVNVPRFDWKSGTNVKSALDEVMVDTLHTYVVRDGTIYFYQLSDVTGLPIFVGPDQSGAYPDTKLMSKDRTPNFDNLRNEIVVMALEQVPEGMGTDIVDIPMFPLTEVRRNTTIPDVPWAKTIFQPLPGALNSYQLGQIADKIASKTSTYDIIGAVMIPGNATIKPYDSWEGYVIKSVTHNMDIQNKTWTTSLELIGKGRA